jgi:transposase InsO family protein
MRDRVVDFVGRWSGRFEGVTAAMILKHLSLNPAKYYEWKKRYGCENRHNGRIPRDFWLLPEEKDEIARFYLDHQLDGYRRCAYMMIDEDVVYCSPSTVYRVLLEYNVLRRWNRKASRKGKGFDQPTAPHEHWHIDISYLNLGGTFYYLISIIDGHSRFVVHWDIREQMTEQDVQLTIQRAHELYPEARPRIISDNGKQFVVPGRFRRG